MICSVEGCTRKHKAKNMCNTHYHAWWVLQPKENRKPNRGRPRKTTVSYWGMHSRLRVNRGSASKNLCFDCGNPADDWTWQGTCEEVLYGFAKKGRPNLNPYCVHLEHYFPRCTTCHMIFDKCSSRPKEG